MGERPDLFKILTAESRNGSSTHTKGCSSVSQQPCTSSQIMTAVFCDVMVCSSVGTYHHFGGGCCFHLQIEDWGITLSNPADGNSGFLSTELHSNISPKTRSLTPLSKLQFPHNQIMVTYIQECGLSRLIGEHCFGETCCVLLQS
jgi:hypothetical protein